MKKHKRMRNWKVARSKRDTLTRWKISEEANKYTKTNTKSRSILRKSSVDKGEKNLRRREFVLV